MLGVAVVCQVDNYRQTDANHRQHERPAAPPTGATDSASRLASAACSQPGSLPPHADGDE
jgi:hypothetical protein